MADPIVGATVQVLLEKALSHASDRIGLVLGFQDELMSLRESVVMIQAVLGDAENKQSHNKAVQLWLKRLEGVAFEADHVLDELHYETLRRKVAKNRNSQLEGKKVCYFSFSHTRIAFPWRMASKIRDINIKLKKVNQEAHDFGLITRHQIEAVLPPTTAGVTASRQTHSIAPPNVVGRVNDESRIVEMLVSSSKEVVSVIPIVGMGGLGKTTLAKSIYNNPQINKHFGKKIWVCVSEDFEEMRLFKLILESLTEEKVELSSKDAIVQKIRKELEEKRYLLVLDDVWNENKKLWDDFFDSLVGLIPVDGSKCLVTTRLEQVASIVSRNPPYSLRKLSDDDCWSIVKGKAFAGQETPQELNDMRRQILKKCDGLPLSASVLGGLLCIKRKEEWLSEVEKKLLNLRKDENSIKQILKLSFDNLPSASIKKCFAYCSIFAKDEKMERNLLIELWMAEGFLQLDPNNQPMEDIGDRHLKTLMQSSLLEELKYPRGGAYYKMHDLVHDLAQSISNPEGIKFENCKIHNSDQLRYLTLNSSDNMPRKGLKDISKSVRTLFLNRGLSANELSKFKNLHVLNLSGADMKDLPASIGKLIHLRFLIVAFLGTWSESVCDLYSLQTLRIESRIDLPKGMSNLISLRHLHYDAYNKELEMPLGMGRLTCLQTLKFFNVGKEKGRLIEELQHLKDLKGKLVIRNLELVNGKEGAENANLSGKPNLLGLEFVWNSNREGANCDEQVLEGLKPHSNLENLTISGFFGDEFPQWLMNLPIGLDKLVELHLSNCKRCKEIPAALGQLQFLQKLKFCGLGEIRRIGLSFYGMDDDFRRGEGGSGSTSPSRKLFPKLRKLTLEDMENLVEWTEPKEAADMLFPMLEELIIRNCSQLVDVPSHFPNLQELEFVGNDHVLVVKKILSKVANLSSLTIIGKTGMTGLTCILDVVPSLPNVNHHQHLKILKLGKCTDLVNLQGWGNSLEILYLTDCDNLREFLEHTCQFQSLRELEIKRCPRLNLEGAIIPNDNLRQQSILTSLERLTISGCDGLTSIPNELLESSCTSLLTLIVCECPNLISFPAIASLHQKPRLTTLGLYKCPKLMTMPKGFGSLSRLRNLSTGHEYFNNNQFDWSGLINSSTLYSLRLYGMSHVDSLPDQLQYLTTLPILYLYEFGGMETLPDWIGKLVSLQLIVLRDCEKLRYLPSEAAMRRLTKLEDLEISGCPLLKERCSPGSGADSEWSKISHIRRYRLIR